MNVTVKIDGVHIHNEDYLHALFGDYGFAGYSGIVRENDCAYLLTTDRRNPDFYALIGAMVLAGFTVAKITEEEAKQ